MFNTALVLFCGYLFTQFSGFWIHKLLHKPHTGPLYRGHASHHEVKYPLDDFLSATYRQPPLKDRPFWFYLPPVLLLAVTAFLFLPFVLASLLVAEVLITAWANDAIHTCIHIKNHYLERYNWFLELRRLHYQHHLDESTNLGMFSWFADKCMRTFSRLKTKPTYL